MSLHLMIVLTAFRAAGLTIAAVLLLIWAFTYESAYLWVALGSIALYLVASAAFLAIDSRYRPK